jgi:hypothetical protein
LGILNSCCFHSDAHPHDKEADHSPPSSAGVKNVQSFLHFPIDLHGMVPNSAWANMPFKIKIYSCMTRREKFSKIYFTKIFLEYPRFGLQSEKGKEKCNFFSEPCL